MILTTYLLSGLLICRLVQFNYSACFGFNEKLVMFTYDFLWCEVLECINFLKKSHIFLGGLPRLIHIIVLTVSASFEQIEGRISCIIYRFRLLVMVDRSLFVPTKYRA